MLINFIPKYGRSISKDNKKFYMDRANCKVVKSDSFNYIDS